MSIQEPLSHDQIFVYVFHRNVEQNLSLSARLYLDMHISTKVMFINMEIRLGNETRKCVLRILCISFVSCFTDLGYG